jgi:hypothetical protein
MTLSLILSATNRKLGIVARVLSEEAFLTFRKKPL